ncbi:MAG TPA: V-type ATP synthase subunit D [Candidatus Limnocylindria bacterium]|nr:V-type ATP synthase subunit D [Candidatus Limnocylindria bacterium]
MAVLRVNPTRMEMTLMKRRLAVARRGHKLLKDKRDEMVRRFIILARETARLRREAEESLGAALRDFALARAVMEPGALSQALLYPARRAQVSVGQASILSVRVPVYQVEGGMGETVLPYGMADTSAQLDNAIRTMGEALPSLIALAEKEKTVALLADEIQKTRRRVNALEYVMIPRFEETIRSIAMKLEENDRGALTRLMKVKEMLRDREG